MKFIIEKKYFRIFNYIFYFSLFLSTNLIKIKSKKLCNKISSNFKGPYLFKHYRVFDAIALHEGISKNLNKNSISSCLNENKFKINFLSFVEKNSCKNGFLGFQNSLWKACKKNNIKNLYYPILDTFIRTIPWRYFFSGFKIDNKFFVKIKKIINEYELFYSKYNTLFLTDTAYFENQLAKQIFFNKKKKVIYLNPEGKINEYQNENYSEYSLKKFKNFYHKNSVDIEKYLCKRYDGKDNNDPNVRFSFSKDLHKKKIKKRKILFLHAFRDANNNTWNKNETFDSYFEWIKFTLDVINQKNDFQNWYIKKHPLGSWYENETEIINKLIKQYSIPKSVFEDCPSTKKILEQRMPVYTNNGTIILETATKGYATYFCKLRFNRRFGFFISSKKKWKKVVTAPYEKAAKNRISKKIQESAKYNLWNLYKKNIPELCPTQPIKRNGYFVIIAALYNQIFNTIFLKSKNFRIPKL